MKVVLSLAAVLALAVGFSLTALDGASARCGGWRCGGAVLVPAPNPIPLRRLVVVPRPAPCGPGCAAYAGPPPCAAGVGCGTPFVYTPTRFYAYCKQPGYVGCYGGSRELLLAQRLLVRFLRAPLLQLSGCDPRAWTT